jgi:hypothetical protein
MVTEEMEQHYENQNHPAVKFFYNTYHDYFLKHCMVCNAITHSTHKCPHDYMRLIEHGPQTMYHDKYRIAGYVSPAYQFSLERLNIDVYSRSSKSYYSYESSTHDNETQDQDANIPPDPPAPPNPPCPMPPPPVSIYSAGASPSNYVTVSIEPVREPQVPVAPEISGPTAAELPPYELPSTR